MDSSESENEAISLGVQQIASSVTHERRVLRIPFQTEELEPHRTHWRICLLGFFHDVRRFSTDYLQNCINKEWGTSRPSTVVGRSGNHYVISFNTDYDVGWVTQEGPWSFDGAFFFTEPWTPNQPITERSMQKVEIWVELWGLPLEYQQDDAARKIAKAAGEVIRVDWADTPTRNIRFVRVIIAINPWKPLMPGCFVTRDDGVDMWVPFKYQRVFKLCTTCGIIGHKRSMCPYQHSQVEEMINQQIREAAERVDVPAVHIPNLNQFSTEMKAYNRRISRRTTTFYYLGMGVMAPALAKKGQQMKLSKILHPNTYPQRYHTKYHQLSHHSNNRMTQK
ncbi:hypothetical protein CCACVL1_04713 [Corchorus capsularis]|uniref:CCHC-type domain-containing protein n=1 Tax=Corchorus capsularis TaxID=210143 RepID=A0A1R3JQ15_COCAP|nr:hypothetical protein CCACVL1_04713 [Corchorus capsularis]